MSIERRRQMIERGHASLSILARCRPVSISRSSFYHAMSAETAGTLALMAVIDASFLDHPWQRPHSRFGGRTPDEVYGQTAATPHPGHAPDGAITGMAA